MRNKTLIGSIAGLALMGLFAVAAGAADEPIAAPTNSETCFAALEQLAQAAEAKDLDKAMVDKVGAMLTALDGQCNDNKLADATKTLTDLQAVLK